jgi:predicted nucleotidyltransferase
MLTEKELRIVELYRKNILVSYTIREVMKKINTKSYNWIYNTIKKLENKNIIKCLEKGKSTICSINLEEQQTLIYLALLEETNPLIEKIPNIKKIKALMPSDFHIFLITGSYADSSATQKSDMDVVVIIDKKENKRGLSNLLNRKGELMIPHLHPFIFTKDEFFEMLTNKEENYGKEIAKKHLIVSGAELYYKILREAIDHGFKG